MAQRVRVDTRALAELRRDLKASKPLIRREIDKELRTVGRKVAVTAAALSVHRTGKFAGQWKVALTMRRGVAVVNRAPQARQQEYGGKVWLRRGNVYATSNPTAPLPKAPGNLPMRRVVVGSRAGQSLVQNEAQYLIRRSAPGTRAAAAMGPAAAREVGEAARRALERALS